MALTTTPINNDVHGVIRPRRKRLINKPAVVVMDDTRPSTCSYHKHCLCILMDIYEKSSTMSKDTYHSKINQMAEIANSEIANSDQIFQTFCGMSFLDRYQDNVIITSAIQDLDKRISNSSWRVTQKLQDKCVKLITRMGTIENLSSFDADLISLLCLVCKSNDHCQIFYDFLLEIGRSIWPYLKRPLWHSEPFVDLVADVFETIGSKLEELYPKNFAVAWKVILTNLIMSKPVMSYYSRLRLLAVIEYKHSQWSLSSDVVEFYRNQYNEFTDARKKEILAYLGFLSSRRKTSLTVKPGRSAADFLKRRRSQESQEGEDECPTLSGDASESLNEIFEEVIEQDEGVFSPRSSTESQPYVSTSPTHHGDFTERCHRENSKNSERLEENENQRLHSFSNRYNLDTNEQNSTLRGVQASDVDNGKEQFAHQSGKQLWKQKGDVNSKIGTVSVHREVGSRVLNHISKVEDEAEINTDEESGNLRRESEDVGKEILDEKNGWRDCGNGLQEVEDIGQGSGSVWQEDDSVWREDDTVCEQTQSRAADNVSTSEFSSGSFAQERKGFGFDRKREVVKVPKKYVGRVIGSHGSVILSIQEETGAKVHIVRQQNEKAVPARPAFSMNTVKNIVHNSLGIAKDRNSKSDEVSTEERNNEHSEKEEIPVEEDRSAKEERQEEEEFEFEIIGSHESVENAKLKIDGVIAHAKSLESHARLKRSFSDGDEANLNSFRRSFYQERKRVIMKVASKYVGRVIGSGGSMIMTIEEESGAKVTFVKDKKTNKHRTIDQPENSEQRNQENETQHEPEDKEGEEDKCVAENNDIAEEVKIETVQEESVEGKKENEKTRFQEDEAETEHEFLIIGTDETIEKAKKKIEYIMTLVDNPDIKPLTRSYSCSGTRWGSRAYPTSPGFKPFQRSLSCPISDWGVSCTGECEGCLKGCYCRSFLLAQSESPSCWIRPEVLSLTQEADWAEFIVKTKVDDPALWRPRKSSSVSLNLTESREDLANDCASSRDCVTVDCTEKTVDSTADCLPTLTDDITSDTRNDTADCLPTLADNITSDTRNHIAGNGNTTETSEDVNSAENTFSSGTESNSS